MNKGPFILQISLIFALILTGPFLLPLFASAQSSQLSLTQDQRAALESQLADLEAQMAEKQKQLTSQQNYSGTLQGDINILNTQISKKKLEIKAKILKISQLTDSIGEKQASIVSLTDKISVEKQSLAELLRKTDELDRNTITNFLLSNQTLSNFTNDISRFDTLKSKVRDSVESIKTIKGVTEATKALLQKEQDKTVDEKQALLNVQKSIETDKAKQKTLLSISKSQEDAYKKIIADQQQKVADIKARLFQLAGGGGAIRFDLALQYANQAQAKTGIDPAYLLAELTQESNLGANVGQCYLTDPSTGEGVNVKSGQVMAKVMAPRRDVQPFLDITNALGFNAFKTAVSCPIRGVVGWGGAMGPAQFIASTWMLFDARIKAATGESVTNPWSPGDAFMAASMYLTDLGGSGDAASGQLRASCKYYGSGGRTCGYGRNVQALKLKIQSDIDYLNQYGVSRR